MANFKRKYPRSKGTRHFDKHDGCIEHWMTRWPASWDIIYHTRPRRRKTKAMEKKILQGFDFESTIWPVNKKPHKYYW